MQYVAARRGEARVKPEAAKPAATAFVSCCMAYKRLCCCGTGMFSVAGVCCLVLHTAVTVRQCLLPLATAPYVHGGASHIFTTKLSGTHCPARYSDIAQLLKGAWTGATATAA
eukprot:GHRR01029396.1.p1 GENE.GHRR01029396.1~~GHRR01029396.1.p1  ORF type:complete len:113 (-),score=18.59 GHRR01029396.1:127-465(-)